MLTSTYYYVHMNLHIYNLVVIMKSNIKVSRVEFNGVRGTSSVVEAVKIICSATAPCTEIVLRDVLLAPADPGEKLTSRLAFANGPVCCNCNPPVFCSG